MEYMLDLLLLRTFVAVVEEKSFSIAATKLSLTQSAISGHIRRLEEQLGKPLLKRTTRSLVVTREGDRLITYARAMLALSRDALAEFTSSPFQGRIRIGVSEDFAELRLLYVLQAFAADHSGLEIDIQVSIPGTLLNMMHQGELDIVIGSQCESKEPGILLWKEPLVWAWAIQPAVNLPMPLPLALFPEPCPYREAALTRLAQSGISQRMAMLCSSNASLRAAALSGFAVAPMAASQLVHGIVALGPEYGLPELPEAEFRLFSSSSAKNEMLIKALSQIIVEHCLVRRHY